MIQQILKGILLFILLSSCGNTTKNNQEESKQSQPDEILKPLADKRWEANPETSEGILNMQLLIKDFKVSQQIEDYNHLSTQLETEFSGILNKCTMKGEAHDKLHDYLFPMKSYFNDLQSTDISKAKNAFDNLVDHLAKYSIYFE